MTSTAWSPTVRIDSAFTIRSCGFSCFGPSTLWIVWPRRRETRRAVAWPASSDQYVKAGTPCSHFVLMSTAPRDQLPKPLLEPNPSLEPDLGQGTVWRADPVLDEGHAFWL